jgi:hypothetical protein
LPVDEVGESPDVGGISHTQDRSLWPGPKISRGYAAVHAILPRPRRDEALSVKTRSLDLPLIATSNSASMCQFFCERMPSSLEWGMLAADDFDMTPKGPQSNCDGPPVS